MLSSSCEDCIYIILFSLSESYIHISVLICQINYCFCLRSDLVIAIAGL